MHIHYYRTNGQKNTLNTRVVETQAQTEKKQQQKKKQNKKK